MKVRLHPSHPGGTLSAPPSKSLAHRCLMAAGLGRGQSRVEGLEFSNAIQVTCGCLQALGAGVKTGEGWALVEGVGFPQPPAAPLDCGESGSTLRFFIPLAGLLDQPVRLLGHGRLMQRPQTVYQQIFAERGLAFSQDAEGVTLRGPLAPGEYLLRGDVSSQFVTGLLFALPLLEGDSLIRLLPPVESRSYIDLTLSALAEFGVRASWKDEYTLQVPGGQRYLAGSARVEGDYSQAAFLAVLGAVRGGITLTGLKKESLQGDAVILDILRRCGAHFTRRADKVSFRASHLKATRVDLSDCPDLGPILMVLALFCEGETVIENAGRLRLKESDRIEAMQQELEKFGAHIRCEGDTLYIQGFAAAPAAPREKKKGALIPLPSRALVAAPTAVPAAPDFGSRAQQGLRAPAAPLDGHNDHRVVMALTILALAGGFEAEIQGAQAVEKSWPSFFEDIRKLNGKVDCIDG